MKTLPAVLVAFVGANLLLNVNYWEAENREVAALLEAAEHGRLWGKGRRIALCPASLTLIAVQGSFSNCTTLRTTPGIQRPADVRQRSGNLRQAQPPRQCTQVPYCGEELQETLPIIYLNGKRGMEASIRRNSWGASAIGRALRQVMVEVPSAFGTSLTRTTRSGALDQSRRFSLICATRTTSSAPKARRALMVR